MLEISVVGYIVIVGLFIIPVFGYLVICGADTKRRTFGLPAIAAILAVAVLVGGALWIVNHFGAGV